MEKPFFSVIIPFKNASRHLPRCLEALARQTYRQAEFILVDNGSTDDSAVIVNNFAEFKKGNWLRLEEKIPGPAAARNAGVKKARGTWLAFIDADCIPEPDWLAGLAEAISEDRELGGLAGCIKPAPSTNLIALFLGLFTLYPNLEERISRQYTLVSGGFPTANLAVRTDVFNQAGGFNPAFRFGEDQDLCSRIYKQGFAIKALTKAVVKHIHRDDMVGLIRKAKGIGTSHPQLLSSRKENLLIIQAPLVDYQRVGGPIKAWVDLNQADKKLLGFILAGCIWHTFWLLALAYCIYLSIKTLRYAKQRGISISWHEGLALAGLLVLKSACMTFGRIKGSIQHRVICL